MATKAKTTTEEPEVKKTSKAAPKSESKVSDAPKATKSAKSVASDEPVAEKKTKTTKTETGAHITHEKISQKAYEIYQRTGNTNAAENWYHAEKELKSNQN